MNPLLSILICGVPRRWSMAIPLVDEIVKQAEGFPVEVLYLVDNKTRTIGAKRQALLDMSPGASVMASDGYVTFVDDDDWIASDYVMSILTAIDRLPDLIVFPIRVTINGEQEGIVESSIKYVPKNGEPLAEYKPPVTYRPPHELSVWRYEVACMGLFPNTSKDEDFTWAAQCWPHVKSEVRIDKVLYHWRSNSLLWEKGHQ